MHKHSEDSGGEIVAEDEEAGEREDPNAVTS